MLPALSLTTLSTVILLGHIPVHAAPLAEGRGLHGDSKMAELIAREDLAWQLQQIAVHRLGDPGGQTPPIKRVVIAGRELPLLAPTFIRSQRNRMPYVVAQLNDSSRVAYRNEYSRLESLLQQFDSHRHDNPERRRHYFSQLLTSLDQYHRVRAVLGLFEGTLPLEDGHTPRSPLIEEPLIKKHLSEVAISFGTVFEVARYVELELRRTGVARVTVVPPVSETHQVTAFSASIAEALKKQLRGIPRGEMWEYLLDGEYFQNDQKVILILRVLDQSYRSTQTIVAALKAGTENSITHLTSEKDYTYPGTRGLIRIDTAGAQHSNSVPSREIKVSMRVHRGTRGLYYRPGERDVLMLRMDQPAYYYIIGHVHKPNARYSYLLPLSMASTAERFIGRVTPELANQWITVGEFVIDPPFGSETVQIIASSQWPGSILPQHRFDKERRMYVIVNDSNLDAISHIRGLIKVNMENRLSPANDRQPIRISEAMLRFYTVPHSP